MTNNNKIGRRFSRLKISQISLFSGIFFSLALIATVPSVAVGQKKKPLPEGIGSESIAKINEPSVKETISYLASDQLEGRGTFSKGFREAADYAVKRFKAAGATGGNEGKFFHFTEKSAIKLPNKSVVATASGAKNPEYLGLAAAGNNKFEYEGEMRVFTSRTKFRNGNKKMVFNSKPIAVIWKKRSRGQQARVQLARFVAAAHNSGASAVALLLSPKNGIVSGSKKMQEFGELVQGAGIPIPVILFDGTDVSVEDAEKIDWKLSIPPAKKFEAKLRNVIAVFEGSDPKLKDEVILFTAHLDHLGKVGETIYNGADDDATGCTGVLTLADAFGALKTKPKRSVAFMLFWGEERGLLGSRAFAKDPCIPLKNIIANVNIEMIGRPEPGAEGKVWVTGWDKSDLGSLMNEDAEPFGVKIFQHPKFSAMLYRQSDNWSFVQKGVIAHSFSAGSLHRDYHQPTDDWQKLNTAHMTEVIKGLFVGSFQIANGSKTPKKTK